MGDIGYLLGIPTQSIAIRLVVAALVAVPLSRVLLRIGIRQPRVRVLASLVPPVVLAAVLALSWGDKQLPKLMHSFEGRGLALPVRDTYWQFAPFAAGLLVAVWASIALTRITVRVFRLHRAHGRVMQAFDAAEPLPEPVATTVQLVADRLRLPLPAVAVVEDCVGAAAIHGIRTPHLLLDARLVERLDLRELEGVIAHELAHVKRRDNLTSVLLAIVRDIFFFVPGSSWASRQLHAERELAADQVACAATQRPASLASGLLKVLDLQGPVVGCAALMPDMPKSTVTGRIRLLVEPQEISRLRRSLEVATLVGAVTLAAGVGVGLPALVAAGDGVDEVSVAWMPGAATGTATAPALSTQAVAFDVYRAMPLPRTLPSVGIVVDDDPQQFRRSTLEACRVGVARGCTTERPRVGLGLRARTTVTLPSHGMEDWKATPVLTSDVFNVYFLRRGDDRRTR